MLDVALDVVPHRPLRIVRKRMPETKLNESALRLFVDQHSILHEMSSSSLQRKPESSEHLVCIASGLGRKHG